MQKICDTGIAVVPPFRFLKPDTFSLSYAEYEANLLFYLTYFNEICSLPLNIDMMVPFITSIELEQVLQRQRIIHIIKQSRYNISIIDEEFVSQDIALCSYNILNDRMPGRWSVATTPDIQGFLSKNGTDSVVISLTRCLPAPMPGVQVQEILEFRDKYAENLAHLHNVLDQFVIQISSSADPRHALAVCSETLNLAVSEIEDNIKKSKIPFWRARLSISVSIPDAIVAGLIGLMAPSLGIPAGVASATAGILTIGFKRTRIPHGTNATPKKYEYVLQGLREDILTMHPNYKKITEYDIQNVHISRSMIPGFYPGYITKPIKDSGSHYSRIMIL